MNVTVTVISGVLVFVLSQMAMRFIIDPIFEQRRTMGEVAYSVVFYSNVCSNPGLAEFDRMKEVSHALRKASSDLQAKTAIIPLYQLWQTLRWVPDRVKVRRISSNLIGLSNTIHDKQAVSINYEWLQVLREDLRLD